MGIDSLVLSALVGVSCGALKEKEYRNACASGIEATAKSAGVYDSLKRWEDTKKDETKKQFKKIVTKKYDEYVITLAMAAAASAGKEVTIKLWKDKYDGSYLIRTDFDSTMFLVTWNF